jgi:ribA/ribD-fused uncharacterized protein
MRIENGLCLFWRNNDMGSNWNHSPSFVMDGIDFEYAEQPMMYYKAMLFNDPVTAQRILDAKFPWDVKDKVTGKVIEFGHKSLGRQVKNYDDAIWIAHREEIMYEVCYAKFSQIPEYREWLLGTGNLIIVEASPHDRIWGIGLEENDPLAWDPATWPVGVLNLLGKALIRVREKLREEELAYE